MPYKKPVTKAPARIVVKQSTIDKIKSAGMAASLKKAASSNNKEFVEGVKRMYGAKRLATAQSAAKPAAKSPDAARASATKTRSVATKPAAKKAATKPNWRKTGIGPVVAKNIKSGNWRKKGLLG